MKWVIGAAWPYVNNVPHLGTMIGSLLSADVFAKYLKLRGEDYVFVSGSDEHGTVIEVEAIKKGVEPRELTDQAHEYVKRLLEEWGIELSNYTRTENSIHKEFVKETLMKIYNNGYIFEQEEVIPYCPRDSMFLPDRFIIGKCPYCGYEEARGDQCDKCGRLLHPIDLINPKCVICGSTPVHRRTKHWFFDLSKLEEDVRKWVESNENLPDNVKNFTLSWIREGLRPRSITRDNKWGIEAPFPGADGKTVYVWFDALLGYISATKEYFIKKGAGEKWIDYWRDPESRIVFFMGKDNIPFHSVIFPAIEIALREGYTLPWNISATEYLLFKGEKFSKSRRIGVWIDEALEIAPADYWRFTLIRMRPELRDANFNWTDFYRIVNRELCDDIGNFIHRVLSFIYRRYGGIVPAPGVISEADKDMISRVLSTLDKVDEDYLGLKLKHAVEKILELSWSGNQYLNQKAPWDKLSSDPMDAATTMWISVNVVYALSVLLAPITPRKAEELWEMLNIGEDLWRSGRLTTVRELPIRPGHRIREPKPLFNRLPPDFLEKIDQLMEEIRLRVSKRRPPLLA